MRIATRWLGGTIATVGPAGGQLKFFASGIVQKGIECVTLSILRVLRPYVVHQAVAVHINKLAKFHVKTCLSRILIFPSSCHITIVLVDLVFHRELYGQLEEEKRKREALHNSGSHIQLTIEPPIEVQKARYIQGHRSSVLHQSSSLGATGSTPFFGKQNV